MTHNTEQHCAFTAFVDLSESELDALLERIEQAKTHGLALPTMWAAYGMLHQNKAH